MYVIHSWVPRPKGCSGEFQKASDTTVDLQRIRKGRTHSGRAYTLRDEDPKCSALSLKHWINDLLELPLLGEQLYLHNVDLLSFLQNQAPNATYE